MRFRLVYTNRAAKDIRKLNKQVKERIGEDLQHFAEDPLVHSRRLINSDIGTYRYRIGDYRVVFDIEGSDIVLLRVGHRKDIYKR
jgi:mRNA interferase RelE/StbE